ncbi:MAG: hypothetical protein ABJB04_04995 [Betaproteobacteria bacterium]
MLAVLLVAIQQLGFAHALTHLGTATPQKSSRSDTQHPTEKVCIECVAFAQLGAGLTGQASPVGVPAVHIAAVVVPFRVYAPAFVSHFRSRAPPSSV